MAPPGSPYSTPKEHGLAKQALMQIIAGGSAGFVEVSLMHPLDLVKTRFQVQGGPGAVTAYNGIVDCFQCIYRTEGFWSFYKGILPPILAETPKRALKFFSFEQYKKVFLFGSLSPTPLTFTLAGLGSGLTEALVINPFEVVKVNLQTESIKPIKDQKSAFTIAREIVRSDGYGKLGLNKGLTSTIWRQGLFNMIYFSFYHNVKGIVPQVQDPRLDLLRRIGIGFTAGTIASCTNIPFDVAKSRIQGPQPGTIKYRTCLQTLKLVVKEEGFLALYKGLLPKVMRLGPGGAIMLVVFDAIYERLQTVF